MKLASTPIVTVSIPCFGSNRYVRRAVGSILNQTHRNLRVVVVNDGDAKPPWAELADIRDPRLIRFSLTRNWGPYFVHHVVLRSSNSPFFLVQDADDWSAPNRVRALLERVVLDRSDMAFSAWQQYKLEGSLLRLDCVRWRRREHMAQSQASAGSKANGESFLFDEHLDQRFINRASHHGLFRRAALEKIGGCYGGFRMNYDTLLTNLLLMTGKVSFVDEPLYHYVIRHDSLSHSPLTGAKSLLRRHIKQQQARIYDQTLRWHWAWMDGTITSTDLLGRIRKLLATYVTPEARAALGLEIARLTGVIQTSSTRMAAIG